MAKKNQDWLEFLIQCADIADDISSHYFKAPGLTIIKKLDTTPVSQADLEIEKKLRKFAKESNPDMALLGEEFGPCDEHENLVFIIDPIDATQNFIRGIPLYATLLAIQLNGEVIAGLVSAPQTRDRWQAVKDKGSFHNEMPIHVSKINTLSESQAFHGSLYGTEAKQRPKTAFNVLKKTYRQRGFGDYYAAMLIAMGCGEFALDFGIKPWDVAPLKIIVEEAGGVVTNLNGDFNLYSQDYVYSNNQFHNEILSILTTPTT
ncbi:inositol monophosphatase family protein [Thermoproteota archaeon]